MSRGIIYVAGPLTMGDVFNNIRNALEAAEVLADLGFTPFVPHLFYAWHMVFPHEYEFWMKIDSQFLSCCQAILRLSGKSSGADREIEQAQREGIPVFHDVIKLVRYFEEVE